MLKCALCNVGFFLKWLLWDVLFALFSPFVLIVLFVFDFVIIEKARGENNPIHLERTNTNIYIFRMSTAFAATD